MKSTFTPAEFAQILCVSERTLSRWHNQQKLIAHKNCSGRRYYTRDQLLQYIIETPSSSVNTDILAAPAAASENPRIAKFEKVPLETFKENMHKFLEDYPQYIDRFDIGQDYSRFDKVVENLYNGIKLPERATAYSAGYDFYAPFGFELSESEPVLNIPTGIRCRIAPNWFLALNVRSGQGFKFGVKLANTQGIVDSDYYSPDEPRTIMTKLVYESIVGQDKTLNVPIGNAFAQGIFLPYGLTVDDSADALRTGAFGSTDKTK